MKKFSELNKKETKVEESKDRNDFIKNLIEETLSVEEGEIKGKDALVETLNKIMSINDSKTKIRVLESVKLSAYRGGFDFNKITEAIELEKEKINKPLEERQEVKDNKEETKSNTEDIKEEQRDKIVSVSESKEEEKEEKVNETKEEKEGKIDSKEEFVEYGKKVLKNAYGEKYDDLEATETLNGIYNDKIYGKIEDWGEAIGILKNSLKESKTETVEKKTDSLVEKVSMVTTDYMKEKDELSSIYESILNEHHLETKMEKIEFILDNEQLDDKSGPKRKEELENMSDSEIDKIYRKIEIDLGIAE